MTNDGILIVVRRRGRRRGRSDIEWIARLMRWCAERIIRVILVGDVGVERLVGIRLVCLRETLVGEGTTITVLIVASIQC